LGTSLKSHGPLENCCPVCVAFIYCIDDEAKEIKKKVVKERERGIVNKCTNKLSCCHAM